MKFTFGTDPEFILKKNGKLVSSIPVLNANKDTKKKVGKCQFFSDNVLAECCLPAASSKDEAVANIRDCLTKYAALVAPNIIVPQASATFPPAQLNDPEALKINCNLENCAYAMQTLEADEDTFKKTNLRSAGGHVHLGAKFLKKGLSNYMTIRLMDLFLGLPSIYIDHDPTSAKRRELYGKAGRFRDTDYGVEYRSIGNFWLASPKLVELVYDLSEFVLNFVNEEKYKELWHIDVERLNDRNSWMQIDFHPSQCHKCIGYDLSALRKSIDESNKKLGNGFLELIRRYLPTELYNRIDTEIKSDKYDLYKEWNIDA